MSLNKGITAGLQVVGGKKAIKQNEWMYAPYLPECQTLEQLWFHAVVHIQQSYLHFP